MAIRTRKNTFQRFISSPAGTSRICPRKRLSNESEGRMKNLDSSVRPTISFHMRREEPRIKAREFQCIFRLECFDRSMSSMHVLIVEDEKKMAELIKKGLEEEHH